MEVDTNEFTPKLLAAIKTKMSELGFEENNELADYVMIMVGNKKEKSKMKNDLMLFLSDNTEPFVEWLFDFIDKENKKEKEEPQAEETAKAASNKTPVGEEHEKSKSRSPIKRSRSRSPQQEEKPKRAPIRAPSPHQERDRAYRRRGFDINAGSNIFKRAMTDTLREDEPVRRRRRPNEDILEVNTSQNTRRTVMENDGDGDFSVEKPETQVVVKLGNAAVTMIQASFDEAPPGDDVYAEALRVAKSSMESLANKQWNSEIEFDDDEEDEEAEIDAFLATAHDSRTPPTEALSRPLQSEIIQKKKFGVKPAQPGKVHERCRFWPNCRDEKVCIYSHPSKPCGNFPNCWFGDKCLYLHPKCKFDSDCTNPSCIYVHTAPRAIAPRAKPIPRQPNHVAPSIASDLSTTGADGEMEKPPVVEQAKQTETTELFQAYEQVQTIEQSEASTVAENGDENETEETFTALMEDEEIDEVVKAEESGPDIPLSTVKPLKMALHSNVPCRFGPRCHNESCTYRHPKRCRFDDACTKEGCYFWHPKKNAELFRLSKL